MDEKISLLKSDGGHLISPLTVASLSIASQNLYLALAEFARAAIRAQEELARSFVRAAADIQKVYLHSLPPETLTLLRAFSETGLSERDLRKLRNLARYERRYARRGRRNK